MTTATTTPVTLGAFATDAVSADPFAAAYIVAELAKLDRQEADLLATAPAGDPDTIRASMRMMEMRLRVMTYRERAQAGASRKGANSRVPGATPQRVANETSGAMPQAPVQPPFPVETPSPVQPPSIDPFEPLRPPPHLTGRKANQWIKKMRHRQRQVPIDLDPGITGPKVLDPRTINLTNVDPHPNPPPSRPP
jgi:hypothetical protein